MVDLIPDEQQEELLSSAAAFLAREFPRPRLRSLLDAGHGVDRSFVEQCGKLGWLGLGLAEVAGGAGLGLVDEALLFRELGRALVPGPFLATSLAAKVAVAGGDRELAERLSAGATLAGLAEVRPDGEVMVWDTEEVDYLLVADLAHSSLVLVDRAAVEIPEGVASIDRAYSPVGIPTGALAPPVAEAGPESPVLLAQGTVLTAAMEVGIAEQTRDDAAAFASTRVQFGKPIGAFQAVKHRCADMAVRAEAGWAQTAVAALRVDIAGAAAGFDVSAAKVVATDAAIRNTRDNIQNHGGVGYTAEYDPHLFLKRAHVLEHMFGSPHWHLAVVLEGDPGW
ncbi:MAG TPA: acyl-CoA dehydrogenase family protein [Acidimicrobiales bacterium]|jgi:alkylation response protein AidB-like acyl-CoA dehydrogenase|nr:acyl-CoA dehydrogenase family protein [Acidimicrobiales bacterium]